MVQGYPCLRGAQPVQAQGELDLQRALRGLPVVAEQRGHAVQALADGVDVHVQRGRRPPGARARGEVRRQRADEVAAAADVVVEQGTEHPGQVALDVRALAEHQPGEPEVPGRPACPASPSATSASAVRPASA